MPGFNSKKLKAANANNVSPPPTYIIDKIFRLKDDLMRQMN